MVLTLQLFQEGLRCTLMILIPYTYILNPFYSKIKISKFLVENSTIIAYKINNLIFQIVDVLHIKKK